MSFFTTFKIFFLFLVFSNLMMSWHEFFGFIFFRFAQLLESVGGLNFAKFEELLIIFSTFLVLFFLSVLSGIRDTNVRSFVIIHVSVMTLVFFLFHFPVGWNWKITQMESNSCFLSFSSPILFSVPPLCCWAHPLRVFVVWFSHKNFCSVFLYIFYFFG